MALNGLHVACGYAGGRGSGNSAILPLLGPAIWSETLAAAGTTSAVAPRDDGEKGLPVMSVRASIDAWIAIGANPNAATSPRRYLPANTDMHVFANAGDKLAWVAA